jgi:hypothetical protein
MQKFRQLFLAHIVDALDEDGADEIVAHFFGSLEIKDKKWRDRIIPVNRVYTADELVVAIEETEKGKATQIALDQLRKGLEEIDLKNSLIEANLYDPGQLLLCPRPHRKYGGLLKKPT